MTRLIAISGATKLEVQGTIRETSGVSEDQIIADWRCRTKHRKAGTIRCYNFQPAKLGLQRTIFQVDYE